MSSNKKFALSLTAMVLVAVVAVVTIVAVFAAKTQQFMSNITVRYTATQIEGKVSARYYVGPSDSVGKPMKTKDGGEEIVFRANDSSSEGQTLSPDEEEGIVLDYAHDDQPDKSWVVFEYVFQNGLEKNIDTNFVADLTFNGEASNVIITTAESVEPLAQEDFSYYIVTDVPEPNNFSFSTLVAHNTKKYVYIKVEIESSTQDSTLLGNFDWNLGPAKPTIEKLKFENKGEYYEVSKKDDGSTIGLVVIPATYDNKPVRIQAPIASGDYTYTGSFTNCTLSQLIIEEGIKEIPADMFKNDMEYDDHINYDYYDVPNAWLEIVILPNSLTSIGDSAFANCEELKTVHINAQSIGNYAFANCIRLVNLSFGSRVKSIGNYAFNECTSILNLEIPSVETIGDYAFYRCYKLKNLKVDASSIGEFAFQACSDLEVLTLGSNVREIKSYAFSLGVGPKKKEISIGAGLTDLTNLPYDECEFTHIKVDANNPKYTSQDLSGKECYSLIDKESKTLLCGSNNSSIPDDGSVTIIAKHAFYHCTQIESLTIPQDIENIGQKAFSCNRLTELIYKSVNCKEVGSDAFTYAGSDSEGIYLTISDDVESIPERLFYDSRHTANIVSVLLGNNVKTIGSSAFAGLSKVKEISLPNGLQNIGASAFSLCSNLTNITIPNSITYIGEGAFGGCNSLIYYTENYCNYLGNSENNFVVLMGVTDKEQETYTINSQCKFIYGNYSTGAFNGCNQLTTITIPNGVVGIGYEAFYNCGNLRNIDIPDSLTYFGERVFGGCNNLVYYTENYCNYLGNSENNYIILMGVTDREQTTFTINPQCKFIYGYYYDNSPASSSAFYWCHKLVSITIPENIISIGSGALSSSINEVIINNKTIYDAIYYELGNYVYYAQTIKVLATADDGTNTYLRDNFTKKEEQENIGGKMYNVYTKN